MTTFNYSASAATASRLLAKFGQVVTLSKTTPGAYDPVTGEHADSVTVSQSVTAVFLAASKGTVEAFDIKYESNTLIETNLRSMTIAAKGLDWPPEPGHVVEYQEELWSMIGVTPLNPTGDVPVIYKASIKR